MRRYDPRLIVGVLLVLGGLLALLDEIGVITNAGGIFWGLVLGAGGLVFLYILSNDRSNNWWAAFPAFTLLGLALASFLPEALEDYDGLFFFAGISFAFWWVYFTNTTERWWALIPAGVLLTLGVVSVVEEASGMETGGTLFPGSWNYLPAGRRPAQWRRAFLGIDPRDDPRALWRSSWNALPRHHRLSLARGADPFGGIFRHAVLHESL